MTLMAAHSDLVSTYHLSSSLSKWREKQTNYGQNTNLSLKVQLQQINKKKKKMWT